MKKLILGTITIGIIVVAAGLYYLVTNLDAIVEAAIEKYGSETTQTKVRVDKVKIDLQHGASDILGLTVANPGKFDAPLAFSVGKIAVGINLESLTTDVIIIDKITVTAPEVFYEMDKNRDDNANALLDNIAKAAPSSGSGDSGSGDGAAGASKSTSPKLRIRHLLFTNGTIQAKVVPIQDKQYSLPLPTINMRNLGGSGGATPEQISEQILNRLLKQVRTTVKQNILDKRVDQAKAEAKAKLDAKKDAVTAETKQKAKDKLKGLLQR